MTELDNVSALANETKSVKTEPVITDAAQLFNNETESIIRLREGIEANPNIPVGDKNFELGLKLRARIIEFQGAIFEKKKEEVALATKQRANQTYLMDLANRLREGQREALRLRDVSYKPVAPAKPKKNRIPKRKKIDPTEMKAVCEATGVAEYTIKAYCVAKNMTPTEVQAFLEGI
jgi:hypothetical protein